MFCYYQEQSTEFNDYTNRSEDITVCNVTGKKCPYPKLKKAQRKCQYLKEIEVNNEGE